MVDDIHIRDQLLKPCVEYVNHTAEAKTIYLICWFLKLFLKTTQWKLTWRILRCTEVRTGPDEDGAGQ